MYNHPPNFEERAMTQSRMQSHVSKWLRYCAAGLTLALGAAAQAQIVIGQPTSITGLAASAVNEYIAGSRLVIDAVNAEGGIHGERIEVIQLDDAYDPKRTAENARKLIEEHNAIALFMTRATPNTQSVLTHLERHGVPLIAPSTGSMQFHRPARRYVFNVRTPYQSEAEKAMRYLDTIDSTRLAVVYVDDDFGIDVIEGAMRGAQNTRVKLVATIPFTRESLDYAAITEEVMKSGAQAVLWAASSTVTAKGINALRAAGSKAQMVALSNNASHGFIAALGKAGEGTIVTQVFPNERSSATPMVLEAMTLARGKALSPAMLEGFAAAKVLVAALRRAGPKPTSARLVTALENLRDYNLGGRELHISYSPRNRSGLNYADLSVIRQGQFVR